MGTVFEELVRRFNEENNEEAGEHWTPRDAVKLMAQLIFLPIADQIESGTYLLYDGACGTGGMLTVAEETLKQLAKERGKEVSIHLFGQEINAETYAIAKADLLLKGEGRSGRQHHRRPGAFDALDTMPSGRASSTSCSPTRPTARAGRPTWNAWAARTASRTRASSSTMPAIAEYSLITRSSDGQMLFLANMLAKMKHGTKLGSRIAEVHNGSSLFTGDAGQGESNIRRWIIENDWLEAIVALPLNMFYNTGIATYIWVLTNRKPEHRKGKVQLIDATQWFKPLRKNLGKKNCELSEEDIERICDTFLAFKETEQSKIFPNAAFGYWKVTVERPLRLKGIDPNRAYTPKEIKALKESSERDENAPPVIVKIHKPGKMQPTRCMASSRRPSAARSAWSSTNLTRTCATPSKCRCWKKAASRPSSAVKSCPTHRTPGLTSPAPRPATKSASPATSTSPSRSARSKKSAPTSRRWRERPRAAG